MKAGIRSRRNRNVAARCKRAILLGTLLAVLGTVDAKGTIITFSSVTDGVIQDGDNYQTASLYGAAVVDMEGGRVEVFSVNDSSTLNVYDGSIFTLSAGDSSTVNLFGGVIDLYVEATGLSSVNIYGYGFEVSPWGTGDLLHGRWFNGSEFSMRIRRTHLPDPHYALVPEPGTVLLISLGGLLSLRRKRVRAGQ